ncbi:helix-turn-helix domain-containing protein [Polaribacter sp. BAL334]|uniref:helix-turn-helix domain-containing protein n=1 Tax=Polaribacter sp. BAL334 TaxID=1708178 RepID=UPI0018D213B3|nr:helix-turn-helix domain-containing protein [Polaribacter sp. BAL334]MBG7611048.1 helix-turn-helix domain-containing protein [Polaribacter sp. BAL334]
METNKITQVHDVNPEDLTNKISLALERVLNTYKETFHPKNPTEWITRNEVAKILSVSLVTVDDWTKRKILIAYRIGNKKRFKLSEVEQALTKINF